MPGPMFSPDGNHFWDGQAWQSAISPDGRWRWDGTQWQPTTLAGPTPATPQMTQRIGAPVSVAAGGWQVVGGQQRTLTREAMPAAPAGGLLPGMDGPVRRSNRVAGYRKVPTGWTNPLVIFATLYFIGSGIFGIAVTAALAPEIHDRLDYLFRSTGQVTTRQADDYATLISSTYVGVAVFFSVIAILLGVLTFRRIALVFYLEMVGGFFSIIGFVNGLSTPPDQRALIAPNLFWSGVIVDGIGAALFFCMLFARAAHGPWGLKKVPVYADF